MTAVIRSMDSLKGADAAEWQARVHLAAAFRLANRAGWNEGIANHFSMIVPGSTDRYLLNPRELHFSEITASNLIVVDEKGNRLAGHGQVRAVAFYLHGRLHKALPGAKCILHAHAPYSTAISLVRGGRLGKAHGIAMGLGRLVCHDDEMQGPVNDDEADRLIRIVGPDKRIIFHAMHGMTTLGATVAEAYDHFYFAERMSMYTVLARQMSDDLHAVPDAALRSYGNRDPGLEPSADIVHFNAMMRVLDREEPDYKS
jgi:ribulose-5-phosphate 4-epimerase/fuculose-1-phosphate aldolase